MRIVLIDDHPIVRQGLRSLLESEAGWQVVGEASDGLSAVDLIVELQPDVAIVDVMLPDLSGLEVVRRVRRFVPGTKIVMLSMHADESYVVEALQSGAGAYVLKATSTSNLVSAIRDVMAGRRHLSLPLSQERIDEYLRRVSDAEQPVDRYGLLTRREREVFHLVVQGATNAEIAERLTISPRTVETHRANLMRKVQARTTSDLYRYALQRGLLGRM